MKSTVYIQNSVIPEAIWDMDVRRHCILKLLIKYKWQSINILSYRYVPDQANLRRKCDIIYIIIPSVTDLSLLRHFGALGTVNIIMDP